MHWSCHLKDSVTSNDNCVIDNSIFSLDTKFSHWKPHILLLDTFHKNGNLGGSGKNENGVDWIHVALFFSGDYIFSLETPQFISGDTIFVLGTCVFLLGHHIFSLETPQFISFETTHFLLGHKIVSLKTSYFFFEHYIFSILK